MKIGFLGNTNNYPFILARAFRRLGHDVTYIIHRSQPLHRPEYRYADIEFPYPEWIHEILIPKERSFVTMNAKRREILRHLRACDSIVLNDLGVSLAKDIARPALAILTGSDLSFYCDPANLSHVLASMTTRNPIKRFHGSWMWRRLVAAQRRGVRSSTLVQHFPRGIAPTNDRLLDEIGVRAEQRAFFLLAEIQDLPYRPPPRNERLRTFCATRLTWKRPLLSGDSPVDFKGSDVMIRGLGKFWREARIPLDINLVRKGQHVAETAALVEEEGLGPLTTWHDELTQAEIWKEYERADLVFEQLDQSMVGMAGMEAMAVGRPLIANGRPEIFDPIFGESSPICQAVSPEDVSRHLSALATDARRREEIGRASRRWAEKHYAPDAVAEEILKRLVPRRH